ncbi:MAG: COX15/CtaA family protein [Bacteroidota bacterium]
MMVNRRFAWFSLVTLVYTVGVVLWGAFVRATGSGAGCGDHWPLCNGEVIPREASMQTLIEYSHRLTSGVAMLLVLAMVIWAVRAYPKRHRTRRGAFWVGVFMLLEAAIGAGLVLFEYVAFNVSIARAYWMAAHLLNTFILLGIMTLTTWWAFGKPGFRLRPWEPTGVWLSVSIVGTLLVGVSGAIAALGDTLTITGGISPEESVIVATLIGLRVYHPLMAVITGVIICIAAYRVYSRSAVPLARSLARVLTSLFLVQLALGYINILLMAPVWMQITHLLVSDIIWILLLITTAAVLADRRVLTPQGSMGTGSTSSAVQVPQSGDGLPAPDAQQQPHGYEHAQHGEAPPEPLGVDLVAHPHPEPSHRD